MLLQQDKTKPIGIEVTANIPDRINKGHRPIKVTYCRICARNAENALRWDSVEPIYSTGKTHKCHCCGVQFG